MFTIETCKLSKHKTTAQSICKIIMQYFKHEIHDKLKLYHQQYILCV